MSEIYLKLGPNELNRLFQTDQPLDLMINKTYDDGHFEEINGKVKVLAVEADSMTLSLSGKLLDWFDLFLPEKMIAIQSCHADELLFFRSKIRRRLIQESFQIVIESPRVVIKRERRVDRRKPLYSPINYHILRLGDRDLKHLNSKVGTGESQNVSKGGVTLLTNLQLPVGITLLIEFSLAGKSISLIGQVKHVRSLSNSDYPFSAGVQFIQPGPEEQALINRNLALDQPPEKGLIR